MLLPALAHQTALSTFVPVELGNGNPTLMRLWLKTSFNVHLWNNNFFKWEKKFSW